MKTSERATRKAERTGGAYWLGPGETAARYGVTVLGPTPDK